MMPHAEPVVPPPALGAKIASSRLVVLDWMRGIVMLLMAVDHSSGEFNAGRLVTDSTFLYKAGTVLPRAQFLTRFITHLCAPTFVFLAGVSLAFSLARRVEQGERPWSIDRYLLVRGLIIVTAELVPSYFWMPKGQYLLQVLYAIGSAYLFMIPLRRLPVRVAVVLAIVVVLGAEAVLGAAGWGPPHKTPWLAALLLSGGPRGWLFIAYPTLPWLAIMLLGWGFGHALRRRPAAEQLRPRELLLAGAGALAVFGVVRSVNSYGNLGLLRDDGSLVQWLHVSKYPPSVAYVALELGLMLLGLAALAGRARVEAPLPSSRNGPLVVFGQTPMFFYLLHIPLLALGARALGVEHKLGLVAAYGFAALAALLLFPACTWYRRYRAAHPTSLTRYL
jgi:uncharacterized membrane protein